MEGLDETIQIMKRGPPPRPLSTAGDPPESGGSGVAGRLAAWAWREQWVKKSWMREDSSVLQEPCASPRRMSWMMRGSARWQKSVLTWQHGRRAQNRGLKSVCVRTHIHTPAYQHEHPKSHSLTRHRGRESSRASLLTPPLSSRVEHRVLSQALSPPAWGTHSSWLSSWSRASELVSAGRASGC